MKQNKAMQSRIWTQELPLCPSNTTKATYNL